MLSFSTPIKLISSYINTFFQLNTVDVIYYGSFFFFLRKVTIFCCHYLTISGRTDYSSLKSTSFAIKMGFSCALFSRYGNLMNLGSNYLRFFSHRINGCFKRESRVFSKFRAPACVRSFIAWQNQRLQAHYVCSQ